MLAIAERLAKADPGNAGWQRDLSVSHNKIGDVQREQGDLAAALTSYRASLAIAERLGSARCRSTVEYPFSRGSHRRSDCQAHVSLTYRHPPLWHTVRLTLRCY